MLRSGSLFQRFLPCRPAVHAAALIWPIGTVSDPVGVEVLSHDVGALVELLAFHDVEVLIEQRPVQAVGKVG